MAIASIDRATIVKLAPNARSVYLTAFDHADADLVPFGVNADGLRLAHFLAQVCHETDGLSIRMENMNYSAERMCQVWPSRFPDVASATPYAHDPEKLANKVYARTELGNVRPGDGWAFIGRGMLQITGREAYTRYGAALGIDLVGDPDLAFSAEWSLKIAAAEWAASKRGGKTCNELADADDVVGVTRAINGGTVGLPSRKEWLKRWKRQFGL